ncbi:hypothetical protein D0862_08378 [Hortaea werneckii]|uniref:Membrane insertase YidC/Oxa/ALB C-terminal domain-containing protein n=1 Tax=Hortaea werneckii TaxID=91943 RepID=A0A3M7G7M1_HORWE|nr:hypothetical protein D0862_08378 [Hortaea werneckii]
MMPSRGLQFNSRTARLFQQQCRRNLSYASPSSRIRTPAPLGRTASSSSSPLQTWHRAAMVTPSVASIRFASTSNTLTPAADAASTTTPPSEASTSAASDLDSITLDSIDLSTANDISQIPEKIGYLHEIGLNYGWGPTSMLEWLLEHVHIYSGMPWWGSIAATAIALRVITFPFYLRSSDNMARQTALQPVLKPFQIKMTECQKAGDREGMMAALQQMQLVRQRAGLSYMAAFTPMMMQGVIGYCGFKLLRAMSNLPVPGFRDGGFLWLSDLTVPDPWGLMPVIMGAAVHLMVRMGGESGTATPESMPPGMKPFILYAMPGILMLVISFQPGALAVWFAASGAIGLTQGMLLRNEKVRDFFGLAPMYKPAKGEEGGASPLSAILDAYRGETKKQADSGSSRSNTAAVNGGAGGRNAAYMQPKWQAPNINTRASSSSSSGRGRVIDVQPRNPSRGAGSSQRQNGDEMVSAQPAKSEGGVFDRAKSAWNEKYQDFQNIARRRVEEKREQQAKAAKKRAADDYEKRAKARGR